MDYNPYTYQRFLTRLYVYLGFACLSIQFSKSGGCLAVCLSFVILFSGRNFCVSRAFRSYVVVYAWVFLCYSRLRLSVIVEGSRRYAGETNHMVWSHCPLCSRVTAVDVRGSEMVVCRFFFVMFSRRTFCSIDGW